MFKHLCSLCFIVNTILFNQSFYSNDNKEKRLNISVIQVVNSEASCNIEYWSNDAGNSDLQSVQ